MIQTVLVWVENLAESAIVLVSIYFIWRKSTCPNRTKTVLTVLGALYIPFRIIGGYLFFWVEAAGVLYLYKIFYQLL